MLVVPVCRSKTGYLHQCVSVLSNARLDARPLCNFIPPQCTERANTRRGKPLLTKRRKHNPCRHCTVTVDMFFYHLVSSARDKQTVLSCCAWSLKVNRKWLKFIVCGRSTCTNEYGENFLTLMGLTIKTTHIKCCFGELTLTHCAADLHIDLLRGCWPTRLAYI